MVAKYCTVAIQSYLLDSCSVDVAAVFTMLGNSLRNITLGQREIIGSELLEKSFPSKHLIKPQPVKMHVDHKRMITTLIL